MGEVGSARYEPALLPPCPSIKALSYSNYQRSTHSSIGLGSVSVKDFLLTFAMLAESSLNVIRMFGVCWDVIELYYQRICSYENW